MRRIAIAALAVVVSCATPTAVSDVALPSDLRIVAPGPNVPTDLAFWSGTWKGSWDGQMHHTLIVENMLPTGPVVVFAWGTNIGRGMRPGWLRANGTFADGKLIVKTVQATTEYTPQPDGTLAAAYDNPSRNWRTTATMTKVLN